MKNNRYLNLAMNGLVKENPVFRLVLGTCPTLAVTTAAIFGLTMGLAVTFVLTISNILIASMKSLIPDKVRIPAFVMIIATFVTIVEMVMAKFMPELFDSLGVFIPLIVVNCIIFARAESFASANPVLDSAVDGLFMGLGFTASLIVMGSVREILGSGEFFGITLLGEWFPALTILVTPAGGFLIFGLLMAAFNFIFNRINAKKGGKVS